MRHLPPVAALIAFERAVDHLSFQKAADELCLTPSAISHRVKALERFLGVRLFHRLNRKIVLTDAGAHYARSVREALQRIEQTTKQIMETGKSTTLVAQMPPSLATKWLLPHLPEFLDLHEGFEVKVNATENAISFARSAVDIAICHAYPEGDLHVEELLLERFLPLCAPSSWVSDPLEMGRIPLIKTERNPVSWEEWFRENELETFELRRDLQLDPSTVAIQAAVAGLGLILESDVLVSDELKNGQLICPFPQKVKPIIRHYYLAYPKDSEAFPKIQIFSGWLRELARRRSHAEPAAT